MIEAYEATAADIRPVTDALARAFSDDPVLTWLVGGSKVGRMRHFFGAEVRHYVRHCEVVTTPGHEGAALWAPPARWRMSWMDVLRATPALVRALGSRVPKALRALGVVERAHPREHHWYLGVLGTDPPAQGKGVGAALIRPVLERCDAQGIGAYLESSKPENVPYYERFGFKVTGEIALLDGPRVWPMWRDPR